MWRVVLALFPRIVVIGSLLGLAACHSAPAPRPQHVARHFLVLVTEGPDDDRHDSIVLAEPLERVPERRSAFAYRNAGYVVDAQWGEKAARRCLDIGVMRADFNVRGCVATDAPAATLAHVAREDGTSIDVVVWFFNQS